MKQNTKEWMRYLSAIALIASAIAIAFVSFFLTMEIGGGTLTYIGEALSASLIIFGFGVYVADKVSEFKTEIRQEVKAMREEQEKTGNEQEN